MDEKNSNWWNLFESQNGLGNDFWHKISWCFEFRINKNGIIFLQSNFIRKQRTNWRECEARFKFCLLLRCVNVHVYSRARFSQSDYWTSQRRIQTMTVTTTITRVTRMRKRKEFNLPNKAAKIKLVSLLFGGSGVDGGGSGSNVCLDCCK